MKCQRSRRRAARLHRPLPTGTCRRATYVRPQRKWSVSLVHHTHLDVGYTDRQEVVTANHLQYLDSVLDLVDHTSSWDDDARFRWNIEVSWPLERWFASRGDRDRRRMIDAVNAGHVSVGAMSLNMHTEACAIEELYEMVRFAVELRTTHGVAVTSAMQTDVPGGVTGLVEVLADVGVEYLSVAHNYAGRSVPYLIGGETSAPVLLAGAERQAGPGLAYRHPARQRLHGRQHHRPGGVVRGRSGKAALLPRRAGGAGLSVRLGDMAPRSRKGRPRPLPSRHPPPAGAGQIRRQRTAQFDRFGDSPGMELQVGLPPPARGPQRGVLRPRRRAIGRLDPRMAGRLGRLVGGRPGFGGEDARLGTPGPGVGARGPLPQRRGRRPLRPGTGSGGGDKPGLRGHRPVRRAHLGARHPWKDDEEGWGSGDLQWQRKASFARDAREAASSLVDTGARRAARGWGATRAWPV